MGGARARAETTSAVVGPSAGVTVRRIPWRDELEHTMPPVDDVRARNRAITARYARWYLTEPRLKWAAMASFASSQTGQVLALTYPEAGESSRLADLGRATAGAVLREATELVRRTNLAVFDDVGWAHHAFLATGGDASAIASELADTPTHTELARGFAEIAHGIELAEEVGDDSPAARFAVWEGARAILRHEQLVSVQPLFGRIGGAFRAYLTTLGMTSFHELSDEPVRNAWFLSYALKRLATTRARADLPDLTDFDQRWRWMEHEMLPGYREVESRGHPRLRATMERFAAVDVGRPPERSRERVAGRGAEVAA
jgi:hypothetical protein